MGQHNRNIKPLLMKSSMTIYSSQREACCRLHKENFS